MRANGKLPLGKRRPLEECLALSESLNLHNPLDEPVWVWPQFKPKGGYRIIHDHGLAHRTAQHLVKRVMDAFFVPRPFQFTHMGLHVAIKQTKGFIKLGYVHTAHLDIENFFGNFKLEKLSSELPIPSWAVANAVVGRHQEVAVHPAVGHGHKSPLSPHILLQEARLGIPQGSACSSIIGAYCVSRLQWSPVVDVTLLNFADDFLLLAKSTKVLGEAIDVLVEAVGNLPGGTFKLKLKEKGTAKQGFRFLGHELQIKEGELRTWPSTSSEEELFGRLNVVERKLQKVFHIGSAFDKKAATQDLAKFFAVVDGWQSAFSECDNLKGLLLDVTEDQAKWLKVIGVTEEEVKKAITPDMEYRPDFYALGK